MADFTKVNGKNIGDIKIYALSTCGWCKKTKALLKDNGVEYSYIDVDLLEAHEVDAVKSEQRKFNPACSFPTIVINNEKCIIGYDENKLNSLIGK